MRNDLQRILVRHWCLVAFMAVAVDAIRGYGAGGVFLGGGLIGLLVTLYETLYRAVVQNVRRRLAIGLLFGKVAAFAGLSWLAFTSKNLSIDPLAFAIGVTCLPMAVVWGGVRRD